MFVLENHSTKIEILISLPKNIYSPQSLWIKQRIDKSSVTLFLEMLIKVSTDLFCNFFILHFNLFFSLESFRHYRKLGWYYRKENLFTRKELCWSCVGEWDSQHVPQLHNTGTQQYSPSYSFKVLWECATYLSLPKSKIRVLLDLGLPIDLVNCHGRAWKNPTGVK